MTVNVDSVGRSLAAATAVEDQDRGAAVRSDVPVLITSERSEERSRCARSIHVEGSRRGGPFVEFDCAHFRTHAQEPSTAMDPLVAVERRFREASGGTLFLDRIEMMPEQWQACLMALLDEHVRQSLAALTDRARQPRIIAGAGASLFAAVCSATFDAALFYRLNVIQLDFRDRAPATEPSDLGAGALSGT